MQAVGEREMAREQRGVERQRGGLGAGLEEGKIGDGHGGLEGKGRQERGLKKDMLKR